MKTITVLLLIGLLCSTSIIQASFVTISPGEIVLTWDEIQEKKIGTISIINKRDKTYNVNITIEPPGPQADKINYTTLPDMSWIKVYPSKISIAPGQTVLLSLYSNIPDVPDNYNQSFECWIDAHSLGDPFEAGGHMIQPEFSVVCKLKIDISGETKEKTEETVFPIVPVVAFVGVVLAVAGVGIYIMSYWKPAHDKKKQKKPDNL